MVATQETPLDVQLRFVFQSLFAGLIPNFVYFVLVGVTIWFASQLTYTQGLGFVADIFAEQGIRKNLFDAVTTLVFFVVGALFLPLLLTALLLPVSEFWFEGKITFSGLLSHSLRSYSAMLRTGSLVFQASIYIFVAPVAMIAVYSLFVSQLENTTAINGYILACLVACTIGFYRAFPFFLAPLVASVVRLEPQEAINLSTMGLRPYSWRFTLVVLLMFAVAFLGCYGVATAKLEQPLALILSRSVILLSCSLAVMSLGSLILHRTREYFIELQG